MATTKLDQHIDSLKAWDIINYYWYDYEITYADWYNATISPAWATTQEEREEETMQVTWSDIAEQLLDNEY